MTASAAPVWAVIAGGGTAGHVNPGLSIGEEIVRRGRLPEQVHFVGSERGVETKLVPDAGFPLTVLPGRGIQRRLTLENVKSTAALVAAAGQAVKVVRQLAPKVLVSLGGYASVPASVAALALRIPVVIAEQNAVPGVANRLISRWAKAAAVSFDGTDLPNSTVTGNPVRPNVLAADRANGRDAARAELGIDPSRRLLAVFGGSLGARRINDAVTAASATWTDRDDLTVRHIIGRRDWEMYRNHSFDDTALNYVPIEYESRMPTVLSAADLVICRAGATTVAELGIIGTPSILVPLPGAPGDHQTANARALANNDAAVLVADADLTGERVVGLVDELLADRGRLERMESAARSVGYPDAASRVVDLIQEHADA